MKAQSFSHAHALVIHPVGLYFLLQHNLKHKLLLQLNLSAFPLEGLE